jgi:hypothetical protein
LAVFGDFKGLQVFQIFFAFSNFFVPGGRGRARPPAFPGIGRLLICTLARFGLSERKITESENESIGSADVPSVIVTGERRLITTAAWCPGSSRSRG